MQRLSDKTLRFSPSDLIRFLDGDFGAWMERLQVERSEGCPPSDAETDDEKLVKAYGVKHEEAYLQHLTQSGRQVISIERKDEPSTGNTQTLEAMRRGDEIIYQGYLECPPFAGYADFLCRSEGASDLGDWHYSPWDTKLARSTKPYFIVQLCAYAEMLELAQGFRPQQLGVVLGTNAEELIHTDDYWYCYRRLKSTFLSFQCDFDATARPDPGLEPSYGRWTEYAEQLLRDADHPRRVAGITLSQIVKLREAGVTTLTGLAGSSDPVPRMQGTTLDRLRRQADLQRRSEGSDQPRFEVVRPTAEEPRRGLALLPPPSQGDVYFDMEGFPFFQPDGLEYLFGAVSVASDQPEFRDWWAHEPAGERQAFEAFVDWAHGRWRQDRAMHIYHYAPYESTALRRLMGKYATRETEVDDLLRNEVLVDLYRVVRQGLIIGTESYSLKDIERCYRAARGGRVITATGSVVAYEHWRLSGESTDWRESPTLNAIREYNRDDCVSTWELAGWLRRIQAAEGISYAAPRVLGGAESTDTPKSAEAALAETLLAEAEGELNDAVRRKQELLAWLLEYHRREDKPSWWKMFDAADKDEQELFDDRDCLAGLERTEKPTTAVKRSEAYEFRFDPDQETRIKAGDRCRLAHDWEQGIEIHSMDGDRGLIELKVGKKANRLPPRLHLIPDGPINSAPLAGAVLRFASSWHAGESTFRAVDDLLDRRAPRINQQLAGDLIDPGRDLADQVTSLIRRLDHSTLSIQGPPGTGKTYTAAAVITELLRDGKRVGVTATGHKVIAGVLRQVAGNAAKMGLKVPMLKVGKDEEDLTDGITRIEPSEVAAALGSGAVLVGGTAWCFARPDLEQQFDYLFIDEAGQFSLANAVAVGTSAHNLILVGDQMQLAQPVQGTHPGESGKSCLEYVLAGHATIPPDFGVLLNVSYRMHPGICDWVSKAIYEGRLRPHQANAAFKVSTAAFGREAGIVCIPVPHKGNVQDSPEEVDRIEEITTHLLGSPFVGKRGPGTLTWSDILIVAPYNMQVRRIRLRLPEAAVGSVDRFQGAEALVVIVSMCASSLEEVARGADFLLSPNRLNVAVSRAQALAIVVGSPALLDSRCRSRREMELVNLHCWLEEYAARSI